MFALLKRLDKNFNQNKRRFIAFLLAISLVVLSTPITLANNGVFDNENDLSQTNDEIVNSDEQPSIDENPDESPENDIIPDVDVGQGDIQDDIQDDIIEDSKDDKDFQVLDKSINPRTTSVAHEFDPEFLKVIKSQLANEGILNAPISDDDIKPSVLAQITGAITARSKGIEHIGGIKYLTNTTNIDLSNNINNITYELNIPVNSKANKITSIMPLLANAEIPDVDNPFANVTTINLQGNSINDYPTWAVGIIDGLFVHQQIVDRNVLDIVTAVDSGTSTPEIDIKLEDAKMTNPNGQTESIFLNNSSTGSRGAYVSDATPPVRPNWQSSNIRYVKGIDKNTEKLTYTQATRTGTILIDAKFEKGVSHTNGGGNENVAGTNYIIRQPVRVWHPISIVPNIPAAGSPHLNDAEFTVQATGGAVQNSVKNNHGENITGWGDTTTSPTIDTTRINNGYIITGYDVTTKNPANPSANVIKRSFLQKADLEAFLSGGVTGQTDIVVNYAPTHLIDNLTINNAGGVVNIGNDNSTDITGRHNNLVFGFNPSANWVVDKSKFRATNIGGLAGGTDITTPTAVSFNTSLNDIDGNQIIATLNNLNTPTQVTLSKANGTAITIPIDFGVAFSPTIMGINKTPLAAGGSVTIGTDNSNSQTARHTNNTVVFTPTTNWNVVMSSLTVSSVGGTDNAIIINGNRFTTIVDGTNIAGTITTATDGTVTIVFDEVPFPIDIGVEFSNQIIVEIDNITSNNQGGTVDVVGQGVAENNDADSNISVARGTNIEFSYKPIAGWAVSTVKVTIDGTDYNVDLANRIITGYNGGNATVTDTGITFTNIRETTSVEVVFSPTILIDNRTPNNQGGVVTIGTNTSNDVTNRHINNTVSFKPATDWYVLYDRITVSGVGGLNTGTAITITGDRVAGVVNGTNIAGTITTATDGTVTIVFDAVPFPIDIGVEFSNQIIVGVDNITSNNQGGAVDVVGQGVAENNDADSNISVARGTNIEFSYKPIAGWAVSTVKVTIDGTDYNVDLANRIITGYNGGNATVTDTGITFTNIRETTSVEVVFSPTILIDNRTPNNQGGVVTIGTNTSNDVTNRHINNTVSFKPATDWYVLYDRITVSGVGGLNTGTALTITGDRVAGVVNGTNIAGTITTATATDGTVTIVFDTVPFPIDVGVEFSNQIIVGVDNITSNNQGGTVDVVGQGVAENNDADSNISVARGTNIEFSYKPIAGWAVSTVKVTIDGTDYNVDLANRIITGYNGGNATVTDTGITFTNIRETTSVEVVFSPTILIDNRTPNNQGGVVTIGTNTSNDVTNRHINNTVSFKPATDWYVLYDRITVSGVGGLNTGTALTITGDRVAGVVNGTNIAGTITTATDGTVTIVFDTVPFPIDVGVEFEKFNKVGIDNITSNNQGGTVDVVGQGVAENNDADIDINIVKGGNAEFGFQQEKNWDIGETTVQIGLQTYKVDFKLGVLQGYTGTNVVVANNRITFNNITDNIKINIIFRPTLLVDNRTLNNQGGWVYLLGEKPEEDKSQARFATNVVRFDPKPNYIVDIKNFTFATADGLDNAIPAEVIGNRVLVKTRALNIEGVIDNINNPTRITFNQNNITEPFDIGVVFKEKPPTPPTPPSPPPSTGGGNAGTSTGPRVDVEIENITDSNKYPDKGGIVEVIGSDKGANPNGDKREDITAGDTTEILFKPNEDYFVESFEINDKKYNVKDGDTFIVDGVKATVTVLSDGSVKVTFDSLSINVKAEVAFRKKPVVQEVIKSPQTGDYNNYNVIIIIFVIGVVLLSKSLISFQKRK